MKSILITGASAGIGRATARRFLAEGWCVGLMARRRDALEDLAEGFENAVILPGDVTCETDVEDSVTTFLERAGRLGVLFNNAGMFGPTSLIDEMHYDEWRKVVDVNLHGMFLAARAAFRAMRAQDPQGGRIINNGSISAHAPRDMSIAYTTTKHAITGMTKSLSLDGRAFDIACGQIDIGNARTDLLDGLIQRNPDNPPPVMDVSHVADAVFQMATLPPEANVQFMTILATKMPFVGRG